jgi:hypothetical protein
MEYTHLMIAKGQHADGEQANTVLRFQTANPAFRRERGNLIDDAGPLADQPFKQQTGQCSVPAGTCAPDAIH